MGGSWPDTKSTRGQFPWIRCGGDQIEKVVTFEEETEAKVGPIDGFDELERRPIGDSKIIILRAR